MSDQTDALQFNTVELAGRSEAPAGVVCELCQSAITSEYYDVNQRVLCDSCRQAVEDTVQTPPGAGPLLRAGVFGFGGAVVGAVPYWAVLALANLEIGLLAIFSGYMVGLAVRRGARGRGGLRFQVLALVLTYASVAFAYAPLVWKSVSESEQARQKTSTSREFTRTPLEGSTPAGGSSASAAAVQAGAGGVTADTERPNPIVALFIALGALTAIILALPVLLIVGSMPSGVLTAVIIGVGLRQAWRMTGNPTVTVFGPYRVADKALPAQA